MVVVVLLAIVNVTTYVAPDVTLAGVVQVNAVVAPVACVQGPVPDQLH